MFWMPESIFTDPDLMNKFLSEVPIAYGMFAFEAVSNGQNSKQIVIEKPKGYQNLNYIQGEYILENQLTDMDKAGVQKAILKVPGSSEWMSLDMCKHFNNEMFKHVQQSNGRLAALAVVPPYGTKDCIQELERCILELGMKGVQLSAHYGELYLDNEIFAPFFKKLNEMNLTCYIHHTPLPVDYDSIYEYNNLRRFYGRCVDQVTAIGRELFSGFFVKYPNLKFVHSMLGGGFFAYANIFAPHASKKAESVNRFEASPISSFLQNNLYFDMSQATTWGKAQLSCAIEVLGADHILFSSSYPVRKEWLFDGPSVIKSLDLTDEEKDLILYKNAQRLYQL
jgi:predicted TIM-barrel fold metal-dependent hydrolase